MKQIYKSSETRLANYFEESRDKWKERSLKYQKEKKQYLNTIRDLRKTIEKLKASSLQVTLPELDNTIDSKKKSNSK